MAITRSKSINRRRPGPPRRGKVEDPAYLDFIRTLPCTICILPWKPYGSGVSYSNVQKTPTEAAHVGEHGLGQKCPDSEAIPLCGCHHRTGADAHHVLGKDFWRNHGLDRAKLIAQFNREYEEQRS